MELKILIVEDQFLEANNLKVILERAGYKISCIAKSVNQALNCIKQNRPDIALLDIFLKGDLTGIQLAEKLRLQNIPFIYLSANSSPSTLEEAKVTKPYGFLVKPFRERDILIALDIAIYKARQNADLLKKQENWLCRLLTNIIETAGTKEQKLLFVTKAFTSFLPFDYIVIDTDLSDKNPNACVAFYRKGFDEYTLITGEECIKKCKIRADEYNGYRKNNSFNQTELIFNEQEFVNDCIQNGTGDRIRKTFNLKSKLWVPLLGNNEVEMSVSFFSVDSETYNAEHLELLSSLRTLLANVIRSIRGKEIKPFLDPSKLKEIAPIEMLSPQIKGIIGKSPKLIEALDKIIQVAPFDATILILGETGVGKEGLVNALHQLSGRKNKVLIKVNCAAIPVTLIESELFGHEKGSFTGATEKRIGKFEQAHGGTLFLDEIGELPLEVQSKLLRAIQEKEIERVGGRTIIQTDIRIIVATNRNLLKEVGNGNFRMDLYYRINVLPIELPPLRERKDDIPHLVNYFLKLNERVTGLGPYQVTSQAMNQLMEYSWPGNIRELQHLIERHSILSKSSIIARFELPVEIPGNFKETGNGELKPFAEMDRDHIIAALKKCNGKVSGKGGAAELLKIPPTTLNSKIKRFKINFK